VSDLHARERHDADWGGLVVDLVEEDRVVGLVYEEEGSLFAEFHPDDDGEPWVFEAADLQRALDTAAAMLGVDAADGGAGPELDPIESLAAEFDHAAALRGPEDEGFYPLPVVARMLARCADLDLAMVFLEGVEVRGGEATPSSGHKSELGEANDGQPWALFLAECNTQARALLERWPNRPGFAIAVEVQDPSGERFVL
jgi:hypothetical protein